MPEGSLVQAIETLRDSLSAVSALMGDAPADGSVGSGFAGASALVATSPGGRVTTFSGSLTEQVSGLFSFDSTASLGGVTGLFTTLQTTTQAPPTEALAGFQQRITQAGTTFSGDFVGRLQQTLEAIQGVSNGVPTDRTAILSALLDQILGVLASLEGPEAGAVRSWIQSVQELNRVLMPIIEQARTAPDPSAIALQVVERSLDSTLEMFGFSRVKSLVDFLDSFLGDALPAETLQGATAAMAALSTSYGETLSLSTAGYGQFRDRVVLAADDLKALKTSMRRISTVLRRISNARILQPGALESYLRQEMEKALAVQVQEVQRIDDPFKALLDRIDAAIGAIDISAVRTSVLGYFQTLRSTLEQVNLGSIGDVLQQQLVPVETAVQELQQGVTDLLAQIKAFFDGLGQQLRDLAGQVGEFQLDGSFRFSFQQQLNDLLSTARLAIAGDPNNPEAPSVAGTLHQIQASLDQFLSQLNDLLRPVGETIDGAATTAVSGINDFASYLQGLDVASLLEQLRQKVKEIIDALTPVDFDLVVDPVVAKIGENTDKLRSIDPESLNELLRAALKVALDVLISIDFTGAISDPLKEQFGEIKKVPQEAIEQLQQRYEQALAMLDELKPEQLLHELLSAFDVISEAVGSLDVPTLMRPLDQWHQQQLQQPLAQLKPSTLLQPLDAAFRELTAGLDGMSGGDAIAQLTAPLEELKSSIADFDATKWVDDLLAAVDKVKQDLGDIRPSELLQPLVADFARLESELDRFKPSVVFQPVVDLAGPLLEFLESVQQQVIDALYQAFQVPLRLLDRLRPDALTASIQQQIDSVLATLRALNLPAGYNQIKGRYFDLKQAVAAQGDQAKLALVEVLDPERHLGEVVTTYNDLLATLEALKENVRMPDLAGMYTDLRDRLLAMLPPYARELLDTETFKRVMRLADPTRFVAELDTRFQALKDRLIPIRPQDLGAELDATYEAVLAIVEGLDLTTPLNQVKETIDRIKGVVASVRVDFLAADVDSALDNLRAMVAALNPATALADLDSLHHEVELAVDGTLPSQLLSGLGDTLDLVKGTVAAVDPHAKLEGPLTDAWEAVEGVLAQVDFAVVLSPIVDRLEELEDSLEAGLQRTEDAFDQMLGAASSAMESASVSAGASI